MTLFDLTDADRSRNAAYVRWAQIEAASTGLPPQTPLRPVRHVAVIGAGTMGGGIALAMAGAGLDVTLIDADTDGLARGLKRLRDNLDSSVARGKLMVAAREGKPIPAGWALDKDGNPTTDPKAGLEGMMLPAGGAKGAMLALTVELLACALSGSAFGFESDSFFTEEGRPTRIGQAFLAIDPDALAGREVFLDRVETLVAARLADEGVRLPGDRRRANRERIAKEGIALAPELAAKIRALAGEG